MSIRTSGLLAALAVVGLGCERATLSSVDEAGRLHEPVTPKGAQWLTQPGYAELQVALMRGFDSLTSSFSGVVCLTVTSSMSHVHECVLSSHGVLLGLDGKPPFSEVVVPVADPLAPLDVTVVVKRVPTALTEQVSQGLKTAVAGLAFGVTDDGVKLLKAVLDGLAPRELPAASHSLELRVPSQCTSANCSGPLFEHARYALTFASESDMALRRRVHMAHGQLVEADGTPVNFPAVVVGLRSARFTAGALPTACRASLSQSQVGDGKLVDQTCGAGQLLPDDARVLAQVTKLVNALRSSEQTTEVNGRRVADAQALLEEPALREATAVRDVLERLVHEVLRRDRLVGPLAEVLARAPETLRQVTAEARVTSGCERHGEHQAILEATRAWVSSKLPSSCTARSCDFGVLAASFEAASSSVDAEGARCFLQRFGELKQQHPGLDFGEFDANGLAHFELDLEHVVSSQRWDEAARAFEGLSVPAGPSSARLARSWKSEHQLQSLVSAGLADQGSLFAAMIDLVLAQAHADVALLPAPIAEHYRADIAKLRSSTASRLYQIKDGKLVPRQVCEQTLAELRALRLALAAENSQAVAALPTVAKPN